MKRQIIALGGGGFSMEPDNPLLDDYIIAQANKKQAKICFIATASGDAEAYINGFYSIFEKKDCIPSHLSLFQNIPSNIEDFILSQDIIYVGGGNTRNMLLLWKEWNIDKILIKAYHQGVILSGLSAGAICWFEQGLTDSFPNELSSIDCLGILKGSNCPHFNGEKERQSNYKNKIKYQEMKAGYACEDGVGLHFINEELVRTFSSRKNAYAFHFELISNELNTTDLAAEYLA